MSQPVRFDILKARSRWHLKRKLETIQTFKTKAEAEAFFAQLGEAVTAVKEHTTLLADKPHPKLPGANLTARDYVKWLIVNAQYPGICRAIDIIMEAKERMPRYGGNVIEFAQYRGGVQRPLVRGA